MLRVIVLGNLGRDAELRHLNNGPHIATFQIASNQVRTSANGEREESTEWFRFNVAGRKGLLRRAAEKGQRVLVAGRLQITHFQRRGGTPGAGFDIWADEVQNVSERSAAAEGEDGRTAVSAAVGELADAAPDLEELPLAKPQMPGWTGRELLPGTPLRPPEQCAGTTP